MKVRLPDKDLDALSEIYRSNPPESRDIDLERYERKLEELEERYGKFDEVGNPNKHKNKPISATILEWKAEIQRQEDRHKGKPTKSWDAESLDLD